LQQQQLSPTEETGLEQRLRSERSQSDARLNLEEALSVLRQRKWSILALTVLVMGAALLMSARQVPLYRSEAAVLIRPVETDGGLPMVNLITEAELAGSVAVAAIVVDNLRLDEGPRQLLRDLEVHSPGDTEIITISYTHEEPGEAQRRARGFVEAYFEYRHRTLTEGLVATAEAAQAELRTLRRRLEEIEGQLARADPDDPRTAALSSEASLIQNMIVERQLERVGLQEQPPIGNVIQPPELPRAPVSPNHVLNGGLGLFVGLAVGIGVAFVRDRLAGRIRSHSELEQRLGAPLLGAIPRVPTWKRRKDAFLVTNQEWDSPASEAYRMLRTGVVATASLHGARSLLVTSARAGEGKTATAANLAVALARAGKKVVLVSADMRRPRLHRFFGMGHETGLSDVLSGRAALSQVVRGLGRSVAGAGGDRLRFVTSGPIPNNPAELLGSTRMVEVLHELEAEADFVILDAPPLLPVTDALVLAPTVGGMLWVIGPRSSTEGSVSAARQQVDKVGGRILGAVMNGPDSSMTQVYYGY
jgi:polysaccharide biosynthesis transport protein